MLLGLLGFVMVERGSVVVRIRSAMVGGKALSAITRCRSSGVWFHVQEIEAAHVGAFGGPNLVVASLVVWSVGRKGHRKRC